MAYERLFRSFGGKPTESSVLDPGLRIDEASWHLNQWLQSTFIQNIITLTCWRSFHNMKLPANVTILTEYDTPSLVILNTARHLEGGCLRAFALNFRLYALLSTSSTFKATNCSKIRRCNTIAHQQLLL